MGNHNVFRINTELGDRQVIGHDSCIVAVPDELYTQLDGPAVLEVTRLGIELRRLSEDQARNIGQLLHHADWVITADPAVVERLGMTEADCDRCRTSVEKTLAFLAEHEGREVLIGMLYWAGSEPAAAVDGH